MSASVTRGAHPFSFAMVSKSDLLSRLARPGHGDSLPLSDWRAQEQQHHSRATELLSAHRERVARGEKHPVWDFLFSYYSYKPAQLLKWHPGAGVGLKEDGGNARREGWRWYCSSPDGTLFVDTDAYLGDRGPVVATSLGMLHNVLGRTPRFGCFGLHEWAMVYRQKQHRHPAPLRLGSEGTDAVVAAAEIDCTHYDAYRFFTEDAVPLNARVLTRATQPELDQPGCLHAGMDIYKWAIKLGPLAPGSLLLDAFELARDIRLLDMEAAPYDLSAWNVAVVAIETPEGRQEYGMRQRALSQRAQEIRRSILDAVLV